MDPPLQHPTCFAIFHLNLAFSALPESERTTVITRCYHPLLDLVERDQIHLGIECNGWSLEQIKRLDPGWLERFRRLLHTQRCTMIGSGYVQMIGALVPARVNRWNQELGLEVYADLLGLQPELALVNEMAFSHSLVDLYEEHGYQGLILERENVVPNREHRLARQGPWIACGPKGRRLPILFSDTILFQKFQRLAHGDLSLEDYLAYLDTWQYIHQAKPVYCSDAEIFGFRPRRYHYEQGGEEVEWTRIAACFRALKSRMVSPMSVLIPDDGKTEPIALTNAAHPLVVKKQPKYNIARWACSGRDDLLLNTACFHLHQTTPDTASRTQKTDLCQLFASDLRTHIHPQRWPQSLPQRPTPKPMVPATAEKGLPAGVTAQRRGPLLMLTTDQLTLTLNTRRGLSIQALAFGSDPPLIGTVPHGYFHRIELGADFYSGNTVIEVPGKLLRVTDLEQGDLQIGHHNQRVYLYHRLETDLGVLKKTLSFESHARTITISYGFEPDTRPMGTVRVGHFTLIPQHWQHPITLSCHNGGEREEHLSLDRDCFHHRAVSSLISCSTGLGASTGTIRIHSRKQALSFQWDPGRCAAFPMLWHQRCPPGHLTRLIFSLAEMDDTRKEGGSLLPFEINISG